MKVIKTLGIWTALLILLCSCSRGEKPMKYNNGLTVLLLQNEDSQTASVDVFVKVGSINETPSQAGLSHFIEHLVFKGSKNYPGDLFSRNVENMGGYINAATSKDHTMYYVNIQREGVEESLKMIADTLENPNFPQEEIDKERNVVIEEIQRHQDNPRSSLFETFFESVYEKSAMRNSIIGTREVISSVSRDEIINYYRSHYVAENMILVVSGNFDKKKVNEIIDSTFAKFEKRDKPAEPLIFEDIHKSKDVVIEGRVELSYMLSGFLGPAIDSEDIFTAELAVVVLGGGRSSRLFRVLRDEKQLVYSVSASFYPSRGTGVFYVVSIFDAKNLDAIKAETHNQIENIIENGISQEEIDRAKVSLMTEWSFGHETPAEIAQNNGYWILVGRPEIPEKYLSLLKNISSKDIQNFFKKYYLKDSLTTVALIPEK